MLGKGSNSNKPMVDWPNHRIIVLPVNLIEDSIEKKMRSICKMDKDATVAGVMWFIFPTKDNKDSKIIRVYVGDEPASAMRQESIELGITMQDNIQRRCLVVMMEMYLTSNDKFYAKECAKFAGVLSMDQINDTFQFLNDHYSSNDKRPDKKKDLHSLIHYIQRNRRHS